MRETFQCAIQSAQHRADAPTLNCGPLRAAERLAGQEVEKSNDERLCVAVECPGGQLATFRPVDSRHRQLGVPCGEM